ncbi:MAG TPA: DUF4350 domain-containing protein [Flavisolibacter sp.]
MKKAFPYILGGVVLVLLVVLMSASNATRSLKKMDERITLRRTDKIPYGMRAAHDLLPTLFPNASVHTDKQYPGNWDSINLSGRNQAVILVADYFDASDEELDELTTFVKNGNHVYIIHRAASDVVKDFFDVSYNNDFVAYAINEDGDSLKLKLEAPAYANTTLYTYPGKKYEGTFYRLDTARTSVLGRSGNGLPNFIQVNKGKGSFYLHTAPLAFSNYFILHKGNSAYFEQAISVIPKDVTTVVWNDYFLEKPRNPDDDKDPNWLSALFSYPSFKWGFLVGAFTLVLFVLLGMRRRQRLIPVYEKPKNDSLDFVKTLGRLYYDRRDHHNLATKMAAYFLEHVRARYKIPTHTLDDVFIQALHFKSGYPEPETRDIINTIHTVHTVNSITDTELASFHKQLEVFYQNT